MRASVNQGSRWMSQGKENSDKPIFKILDCKALVFLCKKTWWDALNDSLFRWGGKKFTNNCLKSTCVPSAFLYRITKNLSLEDMRAMLVDSITCSFSVKNMKKTGIAGHKKGILKYNGTIEAILQFSVIAYNVFSLWKKISFTVLLAANTVSTLIWFSVVYCGPFVWSIWIYCCCCCCCCCFIWEKLFCFKGVLGFNRRQILTFILSKLECGPQEIISREIRLHLTFLANWNKRDKVWKTTKSV